MSEELRLRNQASFLEASPALSMIMEGRETEARQDAMPKWLGDLVAKWHEDRSCVITFNYDTLVEAAYTQVVKVRHPSHDIPTYETSSQIYRGAFTPAGMRYAAVLAAPTVDTFSLLKLHGSWTWLYSGRPSFFGETIYDRPVLPGWELKPFASEPWLTEDKVPLIVPPTAGKSSFFNNETIRYQWRLAYQNLRAADRIFLVGYSVPSTDLLVRFLLQSAVGGSHKVICPVNLTNDVCERLEQMFPDCEIRSDMTGIVSSIEELSKSIPPTEPHPVVHLPP